MKLLLSGLAVVLLVVAVPVSAPGQTQVETARGLLKHVTTRLYFLDEALNKADPVLGLVEDAARRKTLMAQPAGQDGGAKLYRFDVVLQGEGETVFFDV